MKQILEKQLKEVRDEYVVMRSSVYRKAILKIYDNQCSISGLKDFSRESGIKQYENKEIILPIESQFYPSVKNVREHRARFNF